MEPIDIDLINQNLARVKLGKTARQTSGVVKDLEKEAELKKACAGFESIFLNQMLKSMRASLPGDSLFEESNQMNIYKSMYDQSLADMMSESNSSIGIKEFLYNQLKKST